MPWISRLTLFVIFASAAGQKLRSLAEFKQVVSRYGLLPPLLVPPVAYALPFVELATAIGLLIPGLHATATAAALALLAIFTLALLINLRRGRHGFDCGCHMGRARMRLSPGLIARNALLMVWTVPSAASGDVVRSLGALDALTIATGTAVALLSYLMTGELLRARPLAWSR